MRDEGRDAAVAPRCATTRCPTTTWDGAAGRDPVRAPQRIPLAAPTADKDTDGGRTFAVMVAIAQGSVTEDLAKWVNDRLVPE